MSLWFVYDGMSYYPFAQVVEADTPDQAAEAVREQYHTVDSSDPPIAVFPLDALAYRHDGDAEMGSAWLERFDG